MFNSLQTQIKWPETSKSGLSAGTSSENMDWAPKETDEQGGQMQVTSGAPRQAGRTVMTKERKEMIKGGSFIVLGWKGAL